MEVLDLVEQEDGGALLSLDLSQREREIFTEIGVLKVIRDAVDAGLEEEDPSTEDVLVTFDPDGGWFNAVEELCNTLTDPTRGRKAYGIPTEWVVGLIKDNWAEGLAHLKEEVTTSEDYKHPLEGAYEAWVKQHG
jgi:hypothetical protein